MSTQPTFGPVSSDTGDLLDLLAETNASLPEPERQWQHFLSVMNTVARRDMWGLIIDQNEARELLRGEVSPSRIGAFYHRAAREGLIRRAGWNESTDVGSRNRGKPQNTWEWLGTQTSGHTSPAAGRNPEAAVRKGSQPAVSGTHLGT